MFLGILPKRDKRKRIIVKDGDILIAPNKGVRDKRTGRYGKYRGKSGYALYLKTKWWNKRRKKYYENHKKICWCCGQESENLHHKNYSRLFKESDKDLIPLCKKCHLECHRLIDTGKAKLKNAHYILKNSF